MALRRVVAVLSMLVGAVAGAVLFGYFGLAAPLLAHAALPLLLTTLAFSFTPVAVA